MFLFTIIFKRILQIMSLMSLCPFNPLPVLLNNQYIVKSDKSDLT